ncbi:hypothetical protein H4V95_001605 [Arthrobacter sp. CAN_C5]|nr:hypothetical protein [Arthrobacter sp. CAN_C5]
MKILPALTLSEIGSARIVVADHRMNDAAYCVKIDVPDCNRCTKCLRRKFVPAMLNPAGTVLVEEFLRSKSTVKFVAPPHSITGTSLSTPPGQQNGPPGSMITDLIDAHGPLAFHGAYSPMQLSTSGIRLLRRMTEKGMAARTFRVSKTRCEMNSKHIPRPGLRDKRG